MPRTSRVVAVGYPHHITQRGNYGQNIFETPKDYLQYLAWLKEYSEKYSFHVWAYCIMSNHVHFVGVPMENDSLARTFNALHQRYSLYFNKKKDVKGHLWQGRFYSCALDERHLHAAVRYVENNPVKAEIVREAHDYQWSSAQAHVFGEPDEILSDGLYMLEEIDDWAAYLTEKGDETVIKNIRRVTKTGLPCGGEAFVKEIEAILDRKLTASPRGRPRKKK